MMIQGSDKHFLKTRIAPTPSGFLHIGNILSFSLTSALARRTGAKILLRIDDLDQQRADPRFIEDIFTTLNFLEIPWDEGPSNPKDFSENYSQVLRMNLYERALQYLSDNAMLFPCTCSRSKLAEKTGNGYPGTCLIQPPSLNLPVNWRLNTADDQSLIMISWPDQNSKFKLPPSMQHFVVRKKDGYPSYQLSSVIDDLYFGVDLIVRGNDLLDSTAAQLYLASVLGEDRFTNTTFLHHRLLMKSETEKLSKSAGDTSIKYLREHGYKPADIYKLIANKIGADQPLPNCIELGEWMLRSNGF